MQLGLGQSPFRRNSAAHAEAARCPPPSRVAAFSENPRPGPPRHHRALLRGPTRGGEIGPRTPSPARLESRDGACDCRRCACAQVEGWGLPTSRGGRKCRGRGLLQCRGVGSASVEVWGSAGTCELRPRGLGLVSGRATAEDARRPWPEEPWDVGRVIGLKSDASGGFCLNSGAQSSGVGACHCLASWGCPIHPRR